jgi:hypothetical protein
MYAAGVFVLLRENKLKLRINGDYHVFSFVRQHNYCVVDALTGCSYRINHRAVDLNFLNGTWREKVPLGRLTVVSSMIICYIAIMAEL